MTAMEGPDGAFTRLVVEYQSALYTLARRLGHDDGDAQDVVAQAYLRAWEAMARGRGPDDGGERPWLVTVLLNVHRNRLRSRSRRPDEHCAAEVPEPVGWPPAPPDAQAGAVERLTVTAALALLPERQRLAVVLHHVLDLPHDEVADVLGCTPSTARSHCRRGLLALRGHLGEDH